MATDQQIETKPRPVKTVPIAAPANRRFFRAIPDDPGAEPEYLPKALRGWGASVVVHAILLFLLALWFFAPKVRPGGTFQSRFGGEDLQAGLEKLDGLDTPLKMPEAVTASADPTALTRLDTPEITLDPSLKPKGGAGGEGGENFGVPKFGEGTEKIRGVTVKVGDPQFTLLWNTPRTDIDLHVEEPGGAHIYWESPQGRRGGELDVDDIDGFGPENIYWNPTVDAQGNKVLDGKGPPGGYRWYVHYYGAAGGRNIPTLWEVRVKHNGKVEKFRGRLDFIGQQSPIHTLTVEE